MYIINQNAPEGNAFGIMAVVKKYLRSAGEEDKIPSYLEEAQSGDYENLCNVSMKYMPHLRFGNDQLSDE